MELSRHMLSSEPLISSRTIAVHVCLVAWQIATATSWWPKHFGDSGSDLEYGTVDNGGALAVLQVAGVRGERYQTNQIGIKNKLNRHHKHQKQINFSESS